MLNKLCEDAHKIAVAHGFTDNTPAEDIALMHSELSEALEDLRDGHPVAKIYYDNTKSVLIGDKRVSKPCGVPSELADVVIRIAHFCGRHGVDIDAAVTEKMTYNAARPHRNGGKKL